MSLVDKLRISDLTDEKKSHLAWRLDHKTYVGYLTACRIARGEFGDDLLVTVFKKAGKSERSAKIHARKVVEYRLP
jgi:predicted membrane GTPase involved in stress response